MNMMGQPMGSQPVPNAQELGNLGRLLELVRFAMDPAASAAVDALRKEREVYDAALNKAQEAGAQIEARLAAAAAREKELEAIQESLQGRLAEIDKAKAQVEGLRMQAGAEKTQTEADRQAAVADRKVAESVRRKAEADLAKAAKVLADAEERAGVILENAKQELVLAETTRAEIDAKLAKIRALAE